MSILLTGGSGFIGSYIVQMTHIARTAGRNSYTNESHYFVSDISKETDWQDAFTGIKTIIHLAGLAHSNLFTPQDYQSVNVEGTLHLANEALKAGVKRFVYVSSIGVNGSSTHRTPYHFNSFPSPHNSYAQSKYDAELGLKEIADKTGLELVIVRPTLVYGPAAPGNFGMLTRLVNKLPFLPFGLANNQRDFIAVQNLADLLVTCAKHPGAAGYTFLASDGETVSIKEFTNAIAKGLNKKLIQLPVPVSLMRFAARLVGKSAMAEQLLGNLQVDSSNAKDVLGWVPPYTMEQAMASLSENKK